MDPSSTLLAQAYRLRGRSVFPLPAGQKRPNRPWRMWQRQRPKADVIAEWLRLWPHANLAVVTGCISDLVVADLDTAKHPGAAQAFAERCGGELPAAPMVRTGSGGLHLYFTHPGGVVRNRVAILPGIDLRGDGGFVVAPPSVNGSGGRYEWLADMAILPPLPRWLLVEQQPPHTQRLTKEETELAKSSPPSGKVRKILKGQRNYTLFRWGCGMRADGWSEAFIREELLSVNRVCCVPPLDDTEVTQIAASAARYPRG